VQRPLKRLGREDETTAAQNSRSDAHSGLLTLPPPVEAGQPPPGTTGEPFLGVARINVAAFAARIMSALSYPSLCFIADLQRQEAQWPARLSGKIAGISEICGKIALINRGREEWPNRRNTLTWILTSDPMRFDEPHIRHMVRRNLFRRSWNPPSPFAFAVCLDYIRSEGVVPENQSGNSRKIL